MLQAITRVIDRSLTETRGMPSLGQFDAFLDSLVSGGGESWAGNSVTTNTAMRNDAVWGCITVRANSLAQLPLLPYYLLDDGGKEKARDHYLYPLLRKQFNPYLTAFGGKRLMEMWICTAGNAYAWMETNGRGQTTALWPWHPSRTSVKWEEFEGSEIPFYYFQPDKGQPVRQPYFNMIHLRGPSLDGFFGLSPIEYHRQTIGLGLAIQEHGARFFKNGAALKGILAPKAGSPAIEPDRLTLIKERWNEAYGGLANAHKTAFLPNGLEYQAVGVSMADAQYTEMAALTVPQICRIFGVPPHKVFELERSTNNNIEHQDIEWRMDYQGPEITNWEDELNASLLSDREGRSVVIEFLVNALMRADAKSRAEYYSKALGGAPWMTQDEVRPIENLNKKGTKESDSFPITNNAPGAPATRTEAK